MPRVKTGEVISWNEFFKRWKSGINEVSMLAQTKITFFSNYLILIGILGGLVYSILQYKTLWWLSFIMLGSLIVNILNQYGTYQKYKLVKNISDQMKGGITNGL